MYFDPERPRLGYRGTVASRAKDMLVKAVTVVSAGVMVVSAFVLSLVFVAIAFGVLVIVGGYIWWKTRRVRQQMREQFAHTQAHTDGEVIEGVIVREVVTRRSDSDRF